LRRALQKYVESPLSVKLLSGEIVDGDTVAVDVDAEDKIVFQKQETTKKEKTPRVEEKAQA
jgi:ATP-dependent Clp protease ATP-binding subunit ClpA